MKFNKEQYLKDIKLDLSITGNLPIFSAAIRSLEREMVLSPITEALELKKLRHPAQVGILEKKALERDSFDMEKKEMFEGRLVPSWAVLVNNAKYEWSLKYFPELAYLYAPESLEVAA